ncbi:MAG: type II secretion system F family protein, partial [Oscillospiraceae bacterium]
MTAYKYTAKNIDGKVLKGEKTARSEEDLYKLLLKEDLYLTKCTPKPQEKTKYKLTYNDVSQFSRQMAEMLNGGITILPALDIVRMREKHKGKRQIFEAIFNEVQTGTSLSRAMELQGKAFPPLLINMYHAGEESGSIANTALEMAGYYQHENKIQGKIRTATFYPLMLLGVTLAVVAVVFMVILPPFFELFNDIALPPVTQAMVKISKFLSANWFYILLLIFFVAALFSYWTAKEKNMYIVDRIKIKIPLIGHLLQTIYTARFASTLSALYASGLDMITCLEITSSVIGNTYLEKQTDALIIKVKNGEPFYRCLEEIDGLDPKLATVVYIGQESGQLEQLLKNMADNFEHDSEMATEKLITIINPVMIMAMALIIGTVMVSVMLPIVSYYQQM